MQTLLDTRNAEVRVEFGMARAEVALATASRAFAEQLAAIHAILREARDFPEVFVGPSLAADSAEFAVRAAVADLAVRLGVAEQTIRAQAHQAELLITRAPRVWRYFREGEVLAANARIVADLVASLSASAWDAFDDAVLEPATSLAPARFRTRARALRERVEPELITERHQRRAEDRRAWVEPDIDGMAFLTVHAPLADCHRAMRHIDAGARSLASHPDEARTLAQLRADVATDLLAGVLGSTGSVGVTVAVTVPVLTLLGHGDEPGTLDGVGPIDADTARELARHAPSFTRILTHPVTSAILDYDRTTYRVPSDLSRAVERRDGVCAFPGCGRLAPSCDLDHTVAWADGGTTSADNLAALCRSHHRLKRNSNWTPTHVDGTIQWTSPTGKVRTADPPPF